MTTDTTGMTGSIFSTVLSKKWCAVSPSSKGRRTIWAMEIIMAVKDTSIHEPARSQVRVGVTTGASRVVAMVMETDKATSPLAR